MENEKRVPYFNDAALARFVAAEGLVVEKIICHLWLNALSKESTIEIIDNVELHFPGGKRLTIGCDDQGQGLDAIEFNYKQSAADLEKEFGDKIKLFAVDASSTKMWEAVVGQVLERVRVTKEDGKYRADTLVLDFGEEKREVTAAPLDGLIIDYFEE